MFKTMKLSVKVGGGFAALILILLALGGLAVWNMLSVKTTTDRLAQQNVPTIDKAADVQKQALLAMYGMRGFAFTDDDTYMKDSRSALAETKSKLGEIKELATKFDLTERKAATEKAGVKVDEYERLANETEVKTDAIAKDRTNLDQAAKAFLDSCNAFVDSQEKQLADEHKAALAGKATSQTSAPAAEVVDADKLDERYKKIQMINDILTANNAIRMGNWRAQATRDVKLMEDSQRKFADVYTKLDELQRVTKQDVNLKQIADCRAAAKNYETAMGSLLSNWTAREELGKKRGLAAQEVLDQADAIATKGMDDTKQGARESASALSTASTTMVVGLVVAILVGIGMSVVLTRGIIRPFQNIFKGLKSFSTAELDDTGTKFRQIIGGLVEGAQQVGTASEQVSAASQSLAEGSSEQAAGIEETSSSMEEMVSMTKQNAANASEAKALAAVAQSGAEKGSAAMQKMNQAIDDIKKSSDETSRIIKTIDEIAFQTNLLALNAAVEAARAGEAGKGFAVVAEEVRNLAQRSAEAAKNTSGMIEAAVRNADAGVQISQEASKIFGEITESVRKVNELVGELAAANNEQSKGVTQIGAAVEQMDSVTQQNAANAEETASAAEELSAQAEELNRVVQELIGIVGRSEQDARQSQASAAVSRPAATHKPAAVHAPAAHAGVHAVHAGHSGGTTRRKPAAAPAAQPVHKASGEPATAGTTAAPEPKQVIPLDETELAKF